MAASNLFTPSSVLIFWTGFSIVQGTPLKYELTFHNKRVSWNTAVNVCRANGGNLVQILSQEKFVVIQHLIQNDWQNVGLSGEKHYWIGLFDDDVPHMRYTWLDCTLLEGNNHHWESKTPPEPNNRNTEMCVCGSTNNGLWRTKKCDKDYKFICEKTVGECTNTSLPGTFKLRNCSSAFVGPSAEFSTHMDNSSRPSLSCDINSSTVTPQPTTGRETQTTALVHQDTDRSSAEFLTVETTTEYSATKNTLLSSKSPEQSTALVFPTLSSFDTTMWSVSDGCSGSTCTIISHQDPAVESETSLASDTAAYMIEAEQTSSVEQDFSPPVSLCKCPCSTSLSEEESQVVISSILEQLTIEKKNVPAYKRKHTSAPDDRPSAQSIGYFGAIILAVVFGGLILLDLPTMCHEMKNMIRNLRGI